MLKTVATDKDWYMDTRKTQAKTLLAIAQNSGQHPAEIDPVLAEEIASGAVSVEGIEPAITIQPRNSNVFPWSIALSGTALGLALGFLIWGMS